MSKPKEYSWMTKDKLMTYTFFAVLILTVVTAAIWSTETTPSIMYGTHTGTWGLQ